mgnify:CR=1 FL=1
MSVVVTRIKSESVEAQSMTPGRYGKVVSNSQSTVGEAFPIGTIVRRTLSHLVSLSSNYSRLVSLSSNSSRERVRLNGIQVELFHPGDIIEITVEEV